MFVAVFSVPDKSLPVGGPRPNTAPSERHRCVQYHTMSPASLSPPTTAYLKLNSCTSICMTNIFYACLDGVFLNNNFS